MPGILARAIIGLGLLLLGVVAFVPSLHEPATAQDEGALVLYPTLLLEGAVPIRDFFTPYGPGAHVPIAAVFAVFGESVLAERWTGIGYRALLIGALYLLAVPLGRLPAVAAAAVATVLLIPLGAVALPSLLAIGLVLAAAAAGVRAIKETGSRAWPLAAGGLLGAALLVRFDFVLPAGLVAALLLWRLDRPGRVALAAAAAIALTPYLVLLAIASDELVQLGRMLDDLAAGRRLPLPGLGTFTSWLLIFTALGVAAAIAGAVARRSHSLVLLAAAGVGAAPYGLSRVDVFHLAPGAAVAVGAGITAGAVLLGSTRLPPAARALLVAAAAVVIVTLCGTSLRIVGERAQMVVTADWPESFAARSGDRSFPMGSEEDAREVEAALADARRVRPGGRLIVASRDLRRANYADTFLYYLAPDFRRGTYWLERNPGTVNRPDSGFVEELQDADVLILNSVWDVITESTNASARPGPETPNEILHTRFCPQGTFDTLGVFVPCR